MKFSTKALRWLASTLLVICFIAYLTDGIAVASGLFVASGLVIESLRPAKVKNGLFAYTGASLADIFIPEIYSTIQPNDSPETTLFSTSGVAVTSPILQAAAQSGTKMVEVPLWNDLDFSVDPNLSDDTDTLAVVGKVNTSEFNARNAYLNKGYGAADLAVELSGATPGNGDPMTRIRNRFGAYWAHQFQYRIIAACKGIMAANIANNAGDMVFSVAQETTVGLSASNYISATSVLESVFTMGDQFDMLGAIALHSLVYKRLLEQELITFLKPSTGTTLLPQYLGKTVIVDDGLPVIAGTTSGFKYTSVLFGTAAIGYGEGSPKVPVELFRRPNAGNGGGLEDLWERKTWMIHPFGWNWLDASVAANSATRAELAMVANWSRVIPRKKVPMAFMITNG